MDKLAEEDVRGRVMTEELERRLREGLEGVTPGPWRVYDNGHGICDDSGHICGCEETADAAHIANCSPDNIAVLLDALAALRAENEALAAKVKALSPHGSCGCSYDKPDDLCDHHSPQVAALRAENERLSAAIRKAEAEANEAVATLVSRNHEIVRLTREVQHMRNIAVMADEKRETYKAENEKLKEEYSAEFAARANDITAWAADRRRANAAEAKLAEAMVWIANRADHGGRRIETAMQACEDIEAYVDKIIGGNDE